MKKHKSVYSDFEIDKLTNSIENLQSGDTFSTDVTIVSIQDIKSINNRNKWQFDWIHELKQPERDVYKLTITNNSNIVQGLLSLEIKHDHVFIHLIESAPFNKGKDKVYLGVPGNLVAFACKLSFQRGNQGVVSFVSKTKLINHYIETLGAVHFGNRLMIIETKDALKLIDRYFKD